MRSILVTATDASCCSWNPFLRHGLWGQSFLNACRTREGTQYLASVAVIWTELIKLLVCVGAQAGECARTASQRGLGFREEAMHQTYEILGRSWPMLVPAALFVMQQVPTNPCT